MSLPALDPSTLSLRKVTAWPQLGYEPAMAARLSHISWPFCGKNHFGGSVTILSSLLLTLGMTDNISPESRCSIQVFQESNRLTVQAGEIEQNYSVEGLTLPPNADASFAVWGLMPWAMEKGCNLHFTQPIDPQVAANAERASQIWEMWLPDRYRSIQIGSEGVWKRPVRQRSSRLQLFSGGVDSVFAALNRPPQASTGHAPSQKTCLVTVNGIDKVADTNFDALLNKTHPLLKALNCERAIIRTDAKRDPSELTHGFTLASCLFLCSDLFEEGILAADWTHAADFSVHPWGSNHVTNALFAGSDFAVRTVSAELGRTEKIEAIVAAGIDLNHLSFCRRLKAIPENCGTCQKCIRTKAMFLVVTGEIPSIFLDNTFDETFLSKLVDLRNERVELFDLYFFAKERSLLHRLPSLPKVIEAFHNAA
jgi:hypothetical protein